MHTLIWKLKNQLARHSHSPNTRFAFTSLLALALLSFGLTAWRNQATTVAAQGDPQVGPGLPNVGSNAQRSAASSSKAGSILFFHKYTSNTSQASNVNTLITLTNTHSRDGVAVRLAWVHGCVVETSFITLAGNQTRTILASNENPNQTGYLMALAVSSTGLPIQFNWLIGSASYRDARGFEVTYNAVGVAKRTGGGARTVNDSTAEVLFNNTEYDRLPKQVALDNLQNQDPNATGGDAPLKTDVAVYSPPSNLATAASPNVKFDAVLLDQSGRPYPQVVESGCGINAPITNVWRDIALNSVVTPQRQGYATFAANSDNKPMPVLGLSLTENSIASQGPLHSARPMQALSWVDSFRMTVPVIPPPGAPNNPLTSNQPEALGGGLGASEMKSGSILIFPRFTSGVYGHTHICLTNTHPTQRARLRLFFTGLLEPALMNETIIVLEPNQTTSLDANEFAANQKGWLMAVAIDWRAQPTQYNYLIGSAQVTEQTTGLVASYNAIALGKNSTGAAQRNSDGETTDLIFDGTMYDRLPAVYALNGVPNQVDNQTTFGFARPPISILETPNTRGSLAVTFYDHLLASFGATLGLLEVKLGTVRTNATAPPITNTLLKGQRGWLKLNATSPIFPWYNNLVNPSGRFAVTNGVWTGGLPGGTNLHVLTLADTYLLRTPGNNPNNRPPVAEFEAFEPVLEARSATGVNVRLDGRVSRDPDGVDDPLSFKWIDNDKEISTAKVLDYRFGVGTHRLQLVVLDGNNTPSEPNLYTFQVKDAEPPVISGVPSTINKTAGSTAGIAINYTLPMAYDYATGNVPVIASKPPGTLFPVGKTIVTFTAPDNAGNAATAKLEINVARGAPSLPQVGGVPGNILPKMPNLNDQYVIPGKPKIITLQAQDENNDPVTFRLLGAPAFARIDNPDPVQRTAKLIIEPRQGDQLAATNVRVTATDNKGGVFTTLPFRIQLSDIETDETGSGVGPPGPPDPGPGGGGGGGGPPANKPPIAKMVPLAALAQATLKAGAIVKLDGSPSSDPDLDPLTYEWKDKGVKIAEGAIVEVTLAVGIHSITLTVRDPKGGISTTDAAQVEVLPRPLTITGVTPAKLPQFNQITVTVTGTGFFNDPDPNKSTKLRFDCNTLCPGGSQTTVTITSIEEDTIIATVKTTQNTPLGNRDAIVTNPNGAAAKLTRSNYVAR
jgi:hypothetical protein